MKSQMYNIFPDSSLMYCRKVSFVYQGLEFTSVTFPEAIHDFIVLSWNHLCTVAVLFQTALFL